MDVMGIGQLLSIVATIVEAAGCSYVAVKYAQNVSKQLRKLREGAEALKNRPEKPEIPWLKQPEEEDLFEMNYEGLYLDDDSAGFVATWPKHSNCTCLNPNNELKSAAHIRRYWSRDQCHCGQSVATFKSAFNLRGHMANLSAEIASIPRVLQRFLGFSHHGIKVEWMEEKGTVKLVCETESHAGSIIGRKCEDLSWGMEGTPKAATRRGISATRMMRLGGGIFMLYWVCMLVMANYAAALGSFKRRNSWKTGWPEDANLSETATSEVKQSTLLPKRCANMSQSTLMSRLTPTIVSEPSEPVFIVASMTWAFLEWAHYQSNTEDKYQIAILGVASIIGFLPALGSGKDTLTVLFGTLPLAMHLGLLVSDVFHRVRRAGDLQPRDLQP
jgi:hypothetical protein